MFQPYSIYVFKSYVLNSEMATGNPKCCSTSLPTLLFSIAHSLRTLTCTHQDVFDPWKVWILTRILMQIEFMLHFTTNVGEFLFMMTSKSAVKI